MPSSASRTAVLIVHGSDDSVVTLTADLSGLTLGRRQVGGYRRSPDGTKPISPAAAKAFWTGLQAILRKGLRDGIVCQVGGGLWEFTAQDGDRTYAASGQIVEQDHVGDPPAEDSYEQLRALFASLAK
jgi:hypothetical protein